MLICSSFRSLAVKAVCANTGAIGVSKHDHKICGSCLDTDDEHAAVSLLKPAFVMLHVRGMLALGHCCRGMMWVARGEAHRGSIKTLESKHQQPCNWERFRRYICEAGDREEELSNIRKKLYGSPHKRRAIHSPKTWGTNKITWQLHQLIPHLPSLVHQQPCFHNGFPCPHLHFRPPFYFLDKLPLLHVGSTSSSPGLLPKAQPFPPSLVAGLPAGSLLDPSQGCPGLIRAPIPPPRRSRLRERLWHAPGRAASNFLSSLGRRSMSLGHGVLHTQTWRLGEGNSTESGRPQKCRESSRYF